jgi:hypothetical protein
MLYTANLVYATDNALGEQKAGRQLGIVAGGTHGHRDAPPAEANLERFFDGQDIFFAPRGATDDFANRDTNRR